MIGVSRDRGRPLQEVILVPLSYVALAIAVLVGVAAAVFSCSGTDAALEAWRKL